MNSKHVVTHAQLVEALEEAVASHSLLLCKVQIDNLAWINAQYGSTFGDEAIALVKAVLVNESGAQVVGEVTHSIFACLIEDLTTANNFFATMVARIGALNSKSGLPFAIEILMGAVLVSQNAEEPVIRWIEKANKALLVAARTGRATLYKSEFDIEIEVRDLLQKVTQESEAPENFHWVYQPVVNLDTLQVEGYEALIRWSVPGYGFVNPEIFIPIAEKLGVISVIDRWALNAAAAAAKELLGKPSQAMGVNVSAVTLETDSNFVQLVVDLVSKSGSFGNGYLVLELTETAVIHNLAVVSGVLDQLRGYGVKISIDDFGKGETNLHTLSSLPIDYVKLDKSLLRLGDKQKVVSMLKIGVEMSRMLGATVLAEGVETDADLEICRGAHIVLGQGWHLGLPQPIEEMIDGKF